MIDVRENILARLVAIIDAVADFKTVYRNYVDLTEDDLPAAAVLDGDEETDDTTDRTMRPPNRPTLVTMTPEIVVFKIAPQVGPDISVLRRELLKAVLYDQQLNEQIVKTGPHTHGIGFCPTSIRQKEASLVSDCSSWALRHASPRAFGE